MKHYNPFDFYENNENTIDENTVFEETGVSYENIKNTVFENINKSKRKRRKKGPTMALVAIIAIIVSISTTAYASGKFSDVFGYLFSGECENGLYSGSNVKISCTDDNINAEVLGISAGNQSEVYIAYKLTKKDNTAFDFPVDDVRSTDVSFDYTHFEVKERLFSFVPCAYGASWYTSCNVVDEKTIIAYACFNSNINIRGRKMTVELDKLCFEQIDEHTGEYIDDVTKEEIEIVEECKPVNGSTTSDEYYAAIVNRINELDEAYEYDPEDDKWENFSVTQKDGKDYICMVTSYDNVDEYEKIYESKKKELEKKYKLKDNQKLEVVYNEELEKDEFCVISYNEMDFKIKSSLNLNFRENFKEYTLDSKTAKAIIQRERAKVRSSKLVVSPFTLQFQCDFKDMSYFISYISEKVQNDDRVTLLRMNDGTEYYLLWEGQTTSMNEKTGEVELVSNLRISLTNDEENIKMAAIDIENVKEIQIGDTVIPL
ncbi:MAG: hypothetical protein UD936_03300 [Acutalibacteraceae bacterium]|nr:hypothetical protein [Acutalibacteraceae bacterium]